MKKILSFNVSDCTGCRICELVCALEKGEGANPAKSRIVIIKSEESGTDVPGICQHCENPPCQDVCPVEAIRRDPKTEAVILKQDVCIGCRACTLVCPYGAITMDVDRGVMMKCDLCEGRPRCVELCPKGALIYERTDVIDAKNREARHQPIIKSVMAGVDISR
jgi:carbon-monoxide dehydrogenase iron sulfur subunit